MVTDTRRKTILIVDDEPAIIRFLRGTLDANGFKPLVATDGTEALEMIERELPDLVVLDIMMPRMGGVEVCKRIREWSPMPVIMLSGRGDEEGKVECLNLGADDYITKPFGVSELLARIRAVLRRSDAAGTVVSQPTFTSGNLSINFAERRVTVNGNQVRLTPTEYSLLQELVLNAGKVFTHSQLLKRVWGQEYEMEREYLRVFIGRLRTKLEADPANPRYIITIPGVGYKFRDTA